MLMSLQHAEVELPRLLVGKTRVNTTAVLHERRPWWTIAVFSVAKTT